MSFKDPTKTHRLEYEVKDYGAGAGITAWIMSSQDVNPGEEARERMAILEAEPDIRNVELVRKEQNEAS